MKRSLLIGCLLSFAMVGSVLFAQSSMPSTDATRLVQDVVNRLSDSDFAIRQKASTELTTFPPEAYELFIRMVADPGTDPEVRARLTEALPALEVRSAAQIVKIRLQEDQAKEYAIVLDAYDRLAEKNPRWEVVAREGFRIIYDPSGAPDKHRAGALFQNAVDAGCDDPMVKHMLANCLLSDAAPDAKAVRVQAEAACRKYISTGGGPKSYPAIMRFQGVLFALRAIPAFSGDAAQDKVLLDYLLQQAFGLWPEVVNTPGISSRKIYQLAVLLLDCAERRTYNAWRREDLTEAPLVRNIPATFARELIAGRGHIKDAWWARNHGQADIFRQRIQDAREELEKAASIDPLHPDPPTGMLEIAVLERFPRDQMEKWFFRAMLANPDNLDACNVKLNYLMPQWGNGTFDDMVAFGRECLAEGNFNTRVPSTLVMAHSYVAEQSGAGDAYFARAEVWKDIQTVYEGLLQVTPGNLTFRSGLMKYAVLAGQWPVAAAQRKVIGDKPDLKVFKTEENYREQCRQIDQHLEAH